MTGQPNAATAVTPSAFHRQAIAIMGAAFVVFLGIGLWVNGAFSSLTGPHEANDPIARLAELDRRMPLSAGNPHHANQTVGLGSVEEMIDRLAVRLQSQPADAEGWRMLGWSYFHTGRLSESVEAYAKAIALRPEVAGFHAAYGEALVQSANGTVAPQARAAFTKALALDPREARSRYFLGLAKQQDGDKRGALTDWVALLDNTPLEVDWVSDLVRTVTDLARELGVDLPTHLASRKGPTMLEMLEAQKLPEEKQQSMIRGMVASLAARLEITPHDEEGWIRLMRAHRVLGDDSAAGAAMRKARDSFPAGSPERRRIDDAGRELRIIDLAP